MSYNTGATFYPGGEDSYYMPEVVSPAPQRLNEHPVNIKQNVAHMEQQAAAPNVPQLSIPQSADQYLDRNNTWSPISPANSHYPQQSYGQQYSQPGNQQYNQQNNQYHEQQYNQSYNRPKPQVYQHARYGQTDLRPIPEQPNFSPFPRLQHRGPNIPPTPEEQEAMVESARESVLASDDVDMQLTWAQDALAYCEVAIQNEQRICQTQAPRPRTPRVEHMLREDAMKIVEFLADQHQPRAEFLRGMWLEFGKFGYRVDKREAFNCYSRASEKGYTRAFYRIGMQFENSNDALKAIKYYQTGVSHGDAASSYRLGMMTLLGQHGQMQDFPKGLQLIRTAAEGADDNAPQGAYVLGMLLAGELAQVSVPEVYLTRDLRQAKMNVEKAAFLGFAKAQVRMGTAFELGDLGCSFDPTLSLHYNSLAARQGEPEAEMAISKWFLCGEDGVFTKNEEMSFTYAQRAAVSGLATAQFAMGYFYEVGIYVSTDLKQAREWYQKAGENGNEDAKKRINAISRSKTISRKEHENVALQRIRQQHAAGGSAPAMNTISETPQSPTIDMPDPSRLSISTPAPNPQQRPTSTAPYPTEGGMLTANPNFRPASAFGINPALQQRPASSMYGPGPGASPRPDAYRMSSGPGPQPPQRPYSNEQWGPPGRQQGPPGPGYNNSYYGNSTNAQGPSSPSAPTQGFQQQQQQQQRPPSQQQQRPNQQAPPPKVSIGFSAPLDPTGPDRKNPRRPLPSQQVPQASQQQPRPPKSPAPPEASRPSNSAPRPPRLDSIKPARLEPSQPPRTGSITPKPTQQKPTKVSASAAAVRPPGKGPKTFEEMGVPQAQKEGDCIVM